MRHADHAAAVSMPATIVPSPLRVITIITRLNVGGPARYALVIGEGLRALGVETLLVYGSEEAGEGSFADAVDDLVAARRLSAIKIAALGRRLRPLRDLKALWTLTRLVFAERPDIVHTHTAKAGVLGRLAALAYNLTRRTSKRCVVIHTFHGHLFSGYFSPVVSTFVRVVERTMAFATDRIVTVSERQRIDICQRYRIAPASKVDVVELASQLEPLLALDTNTSLRERLGFCPDHIVFGYVGRFVRIKDLPTLLKAFARVAERVAEARLMLVGDGALREATETLVQQLGLVGRVQFTGWLRDLSAIYGAMDVGVLTSRNEGMPLVLIEAMAAARPVIATDVGGVTDLVSHGRTGLLVRPGDVDALSDAMMRLAHEQGLRDRLGASGRREVAVRFSPDRVLSVTREVYRRALAARRLRRMPSSSNGRPAPAVHGVPGPVHLAPGPSRRSQSGGHDGIR